MFVNDLLGIGYIWRRAVPGIGTQEDDGLQVGRNEPCPCGSGKKHKHCCLIGLTEASVSDFEYAKWRAVESKLIARLLAYAKDVLGPDFMLSAWEDFTLDDPGSHDPNGPMSQVFGPWVLYNWTPTRGRGAETISEAFVRRHARHLSHDERAFIDAASRRPYSICEVLEAVPGQGITLRDLLVQKEFTVIERTASRTIDRGALVFCAAMLPLAKLEMLIGTAPYALIPTMKLDVLRLRDWILRRARTKTVTPTALAREQERVRELYFDLADQVLHPNVQLANTSGDEFVPHSLTFTLRCSPDEAFHSLRSLAGDAADDSLPVDATMEPDGSLASVMMHWVEPKKSGSRRTGSTVILGKMEITSGRLRAQVNSKERAARLRGLVEACLGGRATHRGTLIEPIDGQLESILSRRQSPRQRPAEEIAQSPEVRSLMAEIVRQHWSEWFDIPVPALDGQTPRQAAVSPAGRDLLNSLLLEYEQQNGRTSDPSLQVDVAELRRQLGM